MIEYSWVNQVLPSSIFRIRWTTVKVPGQSKLMKVTSATNRNSGFPKENRPARIIASVPWGDFERCFETRILLTRRHPQFSSKRRSSGWLSGRSLGREADERCSPFQAHGRG